MGQPAELAKEGSIVDQIKEKTGSGSLDNLAISAAALAAVFASLYF